MSIPNPFRPVCGKPGGELPPGYTPLAYALFDGNTAVDTEVKIATPCWFAVDFQATTTNNDNIILGWRYSAAETRVGLGVSSNSEKTNAPYFGRGTTFPAGEDRPARGLDRVLAECKLSLDDSYYSFDGEELQPTPGGAPGFNRSLALSSNLNLWLGAANLYGSFDLGFTGRVFRLLFKDETGGIIADIRPALHNGAPCFYDVVRKFELTVTHGALKQ